MELENLILSQVKPVTKEHTWYILTTKWICPEAQNTQDTIHQPHKAQEEGRRPKCGCFSSLKGEQNRGGNMETVFY